jgi:arginase
VAATGADAVYMHVDLDVLDPAVITGVPCRAVRCDARELTAAIAAAARGCRWWRVDRRLRAGVAAAAVDDLGTILRSSERSRDRVAAARLARACGPRGGARSRLDA